MNGLSWPFLSRKMRRLPIYILHLGVGTSNLSKNYLIMAKVFFRPTWTNLDVDLLKALLRSAVKWYGRRKRNFWNNYGDEVRFNQSLRNHNWLCVRRQVEIVWIVLWLVELATKIFKQILWYIVNHLKRGWFSKIMLLILMGEEKNGKMNRYYLKLKLLLK